ncbi:SAM-dependent methyltransferase [Streptosporangium sp. NBC_01755]|uniref:SAM-dependent methyltransferase n=1 Tax=unclassified Streptosporangium TaxID=2632669 RepID=UPI002DDC1A77|nr:MULTISPECIES: SAM-dependent methyltransferase [unclassified Streptosporangium]WSA25851.1 SAM-dependent methyltransferase [Streptosporangium sp. NBC_01810]WSD02756.1 SAM-dependent methyltransferase [Streptosporangium sp. NBC_01755]
MPDETLPHTSGRQSVNPIDSSVAHSARIWNYWLGGKDNYAIDREIGDQFVGIFPEIVDIARSSRAFLSRAVEYMADEGGIRQFLDIGTGLPTVDNTHQVAQRVAPDARIVYVDNDPMVLTHARALLTGTAEGTTEYIDSNVRDPDRILEAAQATLDFDRPIGLMLMNILGHITDIDEGRSIARRLLEALPSGSYLAVADGTNVIKGGKFEKAIAIWNEAGSVPYTLRSPEQIASYFEGLELVEPGVVSCPLWRPGPSIVGGLREVDEFCAVGRKP